MDTELKALISRVLKHQIEGVMLHFDLMQQYHLMGDSKMCRMHLKRYEEESKCHAKTSLDVIEKYHEIIPPLAVNVALNKTYATGSDMLKEWLSWEKETLEMYNQILGKEPSCGVWKYLVRNTEKEIKCIEKIMR